MTEENDNKPNDAVAQGTEPERAGYGKSATDEIHELTTIGDNSLANPIELNTGPADKKITASGNGGSFHASNVSEAEGQVQKLPFPKSIFFIIGYELCRGFHSYGLRTILVLYLSRQLDYDDDTTTVIFHVYSMIGYFLCVFGAIISDSWLGKFKTIFYLSFIYVAGSALVTLGAVPPLNLPATTFTMVGLGLMSLGSGLVKPSISAFGGDQFKLPEQVKQMTTFFSMYYFVVNAGSLISITATPILRDDVHCFGEKDCYSLAFGLPASFVVISIVVFALGRPLYKNKPPAGNMVVLVSKTIGNAIATKWREKKTNPREHWLDYADKKYDRQLIEDVKVLMRVLVLYLPLPVFWALFDQQGSRWTIQATRMDGDMGSWNIKPDQMQLINPFLILAFIPLYELAFYPLLAFVGIRRPLQKLTLGGIFAGIAFIVSGLVELSLEDTYPILPTAGNAQLRVYNGENCNYAITSNLTDLNFDIASLDMFVNRSINIDSTNHLYVEFEFTEKAGLNCFAFPKQTFVFDTTTAHYLFLNSKNTTHPLIWGKDTISKPSRGYPFVRTLANVQAGRQIEWRTKKGSIEHTEPANLRNETELKSGGYEIFVDNTLAAAEYLKVGGRYTVIINEETTGVYKSNVVIVTEPNSMSIFWLIPQYVIMTLGEVMFSVTGLEFSYAQAPVSMKSVLQACWLLTVAFGNVIVVIIAELKLFDSQADEFFLFSGIMFVDMIIFMFVAYRYKPNNPNSQSEAEPLTPAETNEKVGIDSVAKSIGE
ncbi:PREDICTED: peptide transporter family 1-like [Bactrocera latifrons]|uniref:peptide transporter family 1-like n=1 Tax=Bactrocera latifrons TaxID=174628 RepID=UPI0008DDE60D|nr:PREDICTED: peptide transporter family 1-like [Bactrocera latifrons]